jgi:hypothetical protein
MTNIFNLKGGQDEKATATVSIEPTPTMRLHSRTQILEEKERRQRLTLVAEEEQRQQLTINKNKPTEGTHIVQVTQPHNVYKQDNKLMPVPPPLVPRTTTLVTRSIPVGESGFQQVPSWLSPRLTNNIVTKCKLDWQQNMVTDRSKQAPFKEKARMLQIFGAFLIMHPQSGYVTCIHSAHVYHPLAGSPSELDDEVVIFTWR